eukprot:5842946-Prymnesium_polylepis.1
MPVDASLFAPVCCLFSSAPEVNARPNTRSQERSRTLGTLCERLTGQLGAAKAQADAWAHEATSAKAALAKQPPRATAPPAKERGVGASHRAPSAAGSKEAREPTDSQRARRPPSPRPPSPARGGGGTAGGVGTAGGG